MDSECDSLRAQIDLCHKLGFCHLDISPRNILPKRGPAVLMDCDCVCRLGRSALIPPESSRNVKDRDAEYVWEQPLRIPLVFEDSASSSDV